MITPQLDRYGDQLLGVRRAGSTLAMNIGEGADPAGLGSATRFNLMDRGRPRYAAAHVAELGDDGTNDLLVSEVIRTGEMEAWFLAEHLVDTPLVRADRPEEDR
jgi:hypothetical protein